MVLTVVALTLITIGLLLGIGGYLVLFLLLSRAKEWTDMLASNLMCKTVMDVGIALFFIGIGVGAIGLMLKGLTAS